MGFARDTDYTSTLNDWRALVGGEAMILLIAGLVLYVGDGWRRLSKIFGSVIADSHTFRCGGTVFGPTQVMMDASTESYSHFLIEILTNSGLIIIVVGPDTVSH